MKNKFKNLAIPTGAFSGVSNGSNHIFLDGINQSINYPIIHTDNGGSITIPNNSYVTYYDTDGKVFVQIDHATLPVAATYNMTKSHQLYMTHTKALTTAELIEMNSNPNLIMSVWFDGASLGDGFIKSDIVNFCVPIEGALGGNAVIDLAIPPENVLAPNPTISEVRAVITQNGDGSITIENANTEPSPYGYFRLSQTGQAGQLTRDLINGEFVKFKINMKVDNLGIYCGTSSLSSADVFLENINTYEDVYVCGTFNGSNSSFIKLGLISNIVNSFTYWPDSIEIEIYTAYEIENYTATCRTNLVNRDYGISNLLLKQDASGVPIGITADNTIEFFGDDYVSTGITPNLDTYTIEEVITPTATGVKEVRRLTHNNGTYKYYLNGMEQGTNPSVPNTNTILALGRQSTIGVIEDIDNREKHFRVWTIVQAP